MPTLSNDWLSSVLSIAVVSFHARTLQEGIKTGHLKLVDVESEGGKKLSVVVKETRSGSDGRQLSQVLGLPRESYFYNDLAARLDHKDIAKVYHAEGSLETGETLLVMEDLSRGVQSGYFFGAGNPMNWGKDLDTAVAKGAGASAREIAKKAFMLAARLHVAFWGSEDLLGHKWLKGCKWISGEDENGWTEAQMQTKALWDTMKASIGSGKAEVKWSQEVVQVIDASVQKAANDDAWKCTLALLQKRPWTLLHGDFHPGNMIYLPPQQGAPAEPASGSLKLLDWEMVSVGSGPQDLAQYMISHASPQLRRECEKELLASYHQHLVGAMAEKHGAGWAASYPLEQCEAEYVAGGVGKWVWLLVQMGGGMSLPAPVMQFFHDQFHAFLVDHSVGPSSDLVQAPRV